MREFHAGRGSRQLLMTGHSPFSASVAFARNDKDVGYDK